MVWYFRSLESNKPIKEKKIYNKALNISVNIVTVLPTYRHIFFQEKGHNSDYKHIAKNKS